GLRGDRDRWGNGHQRGLFPPRQLPGNRLSGNDFGYRGGHLDPPERSTHSQGTALAGRAQVTQVRRERPMRCMVCLRMAGLPGTTILSWRLQDEVFLMTTRRWGLTLMLLCSLVVTGVCLRKCRSQSRSGGLCTTQSGGTRVSMTGVGTGGLSAQSGTATQSIITYSAPDGTTHCTV